MLRRDCIRGLVNIALESGIADFLDKETLHDLHIRALQLRWASFVVELRLNIT